MVKLLLDSGADIQKKNNNNETALTIVSSHDTVITKILTEHIHKKAFHKAAGKNKIRDYVAFIRSYYDSRLVDNAVDSIYTLLVKNYPSEEYTRVFPKTHSNHNLLKHSNKMNPSSLHLLLIL